MNNTFDEVRIVDTYTVAVTANVHEDSEVGEMSTGAHRVCHVGVHQLTAEVIPMPLHVSVKYNSHT